jgi:hypothetical protein
MSRNPASSREQLSTIESIIAETYVNEIAKKNEFTPF